MINAVYFTSFMLCSDESWTIYQHWDNPPPPQLPSPPFFCIIHTCIFSYSFMIRIFFIPIGDYKWNCRPSRRRLWSKWSKWRRNRRERCFHAPIRSPNSNIRRRFRSVRWWNKGNVAHLPRRILRSETVMTCNITHTSSPNTAPSKKSKKKKTRNWKRVKPSFSIPQPQEPDDTEEEVQVERFMKKQGRMKILMPGPLHAYNSHMGGVDLFDQCLANYRSSIRTKKWWLLFQWGVDASRSNPWLLSRRSKDSPQLPFIRYMAKNLMKRNTVPWPRSGYKGKIGAGIGI